MVATVLLTAVVGSFTDEIVSYFLNSGGDQSKPTVTQNEAVAAQQEKDRQTKVAAEKAAADREAELRKRGKLSISLLSDFDKTTKVIMGEWKVAGGSLTGAGASGHDQCKIELGNIPFKEYDFTTTFVIKRRSTDGFGDLFMRLPYLKQYLIFRTTKGTVGKTHIGFNISSQYVDPKSSATFPDRLTLGKPYHLLVRVREGSNVQILLDGKQIVVTKVAAQERPNMSISMTGVVAFKSLNFVAVH